MDVHQIILKVNDKILNKASFKTHVSRAQYYSLSTVLKNCFIRNYLQYSKYI